MKSKVNTFLIIFSLILSQMLIAQDDDIGQFEVWRYEHLPVRFLMDMNNVPNGLQNNSNTRNYLINEAEKWNSPDFQSQLFSIGLSPLNPVVTLELGSNRNTKNEIVFTVWDQNAFGDALGVTDSDTNNPECNYNTPGFPGSCIDVIDTVDVFINPFYSFFINNPTSSCQGVYNAEELLTHEMGHALGSRHTFANLAEAVMDSTLGVCSKTAITSEDFRLIKKLYHNNETVNVEVQNPQNGTVVIANENNEFFANITPKGNTRSSEKAIYLEDVEDQMKWVSSIDGEIAVGNNQYVTGLSAGQHDLTVTIGEPGDEVYGVGVSSFYVVDQIITTDQDVFHPFPCPRSIDDPQGSCLMTTRMDLYRYRCSDNLYRHGNMSARNLGDNLSDPSDDTIIPVSVDYFPYCTTDYTTYSYQFYTWINDFDDFVNFSLNYELENVGRPSAYYRFDQSVPLVNSEIYVSQIEDCNVNHISEKCSTTINWTELYFAPDAGIFYRDPPSSQWQMLTGISGRDGSYQTSNIVDTDGVEFAVFQYSHDLCRRSESGSPTCFGGPIIDAPSGMMAGPIEVKAIATDTTPIPVLDLVQTLSSNNYKIELIGDDFGSFPSVSIRENVNGSQPIKVFPNSFFHNQGTHSSTHTHAGKNFIRFPIIEVPHQNLFNGNGLCFQVVNGSQQSNEKCLVRSASNPQPQFMGEYLQSYHHSQQQQDEDPDAYIVKSNGSLMKLWGNSWKKIPYNYTVTSDTQINLDFASTLNEGELSGIGFVLEGQSNVTSNQFWQFHGTQTWGHQNHNDYNGTAYKNYIINIGKKFTGRISHIVFVADDDNERVGQNVVFKPVSFRESNIDASDDVPNQRAFDDDEKGRGLIRPEPGSQLHNFHDQGDVDWSIVYGPQFRVRTNLIGSNADTKLTVYRWISADVDNTNGYFINVVDEELGSDDSVGASEFTLYGTENHTYAFKVESRNGAFGEGTEYELILEEAPPFEADSYDNVPTERAFDDDMKGKAKLWTNIAMNSEVHNLHDQGDVDWTIIYAEDFSVEMQRVGANANHKISLYKWISATHNSSLGYFTHVNDQYLSNSTNSWVNPLINYATEAGTFAVKVESPTGDYGPGTEYRLIFNGLTAGSPDAYEHSTYLSDDHEGSPVMWQGATDVVHDQNFHDNGDVDWTMVYHNQFTANVEVIGDAADVKVTAYKWISAEQDPNTGVFTNIQKVEVDRDWSAGDSTVSYSGEMAPYLIKVESRNGAFGNNTAYKLRIY